MTTSSTSPRSSASPVIVGPVIEASRLAPGSDARPLGRATFVRWTTRADGDMRPPAVGTHTVLARVAGRPVAWATQVHGAGVVVAEGPGHVGPADAVVSAHPGQGVAVFAADCAPVALSGGDGRGRDHVVAAVHAGWRGLAAGVIDAAVDALRSRGATRVVAALGPCIHRECYAVGDDVLVPLAESFGAAVVSTAVDGRPSLDLPAAVRIAIGRAGVELVHEDPTCTACAVVSCFSHRARGDIGRAAMVVWRAGA